MPVLACALIEATADGVAVHSTDMTCWMTTRVACTPRKTGSVAIPVTHLANIWRTLPDGDVTFHVRKGEARVEITAGRTSMRVVSVSAADFPERPSEPDRYVSVGAAAIADLIGRVLPSVSTDEARLNLNGAQLDAATSTMVSTDGHRLTKYSADVSLKALGRRKVIVPRVGLAAAAKLLAEGGDAEVGIEGAHLHLRVGATTMAVRLNDVSFPPWEQVVPKEVNVQARLATDDLRQALLQAAVVAPEKTHTVAVTLSATELELQADNPEMGALSTTISAETVGLGKTPLRMGLNATYILDALAQTQSERVSLEFVGELDPVLVRPVDEGEGAADILAVVMPMRI